MASYYRYEDGEIRYYPNGLPERAVAKNAAEKKQTKSKK